MKKKTGWILLLVVVAAVRWGYFKNEDYLWEKEVRALPITQYMLSSELDTNEYHTLNRLVRMVTFRWDEPPSLDQLPLRARLEAAENIHRPGSFNLVSEEISDISVFKHLTNVTFLSLPANSIRSLDGLSRCVDLRDLSIPGNQVTNLAPLKNLTNLEELDLRENPIADYGALKNLPKLRTLRLGADQLPAFSHLDSVSAVQQLDVIDQFGSSRPLDSFEGLPAMPELRGIRGAKARSLEGIQKFTNLMNVVNMSGNVDSLAPLIALRKLTHVDFSESRVRDLTPLASLLELRKISIATQAVELDLAPLSNLKKLHEVSLSVAGKGLDVTKLTRGLESWKSEFRSERARHSPKLALEIVDQKTFDHFNGTERYGLDEWDGNEGMLRSEFHWLEDQIAEAFPSPAKEDEDYTLPHRWEVARSLTLWVHNDSLLNQFPRLATRVQKVLAHCRNDWIVYFDSDHFTVWIYPEKIVSTPNNEATVRAFIKRE